MPAALGALRRPRQILLVRAGAGVILRGLDSRGAALLSFSPRKNRLYCIFSLRLR